MIELLIILISLLILVDIVYLAIKISKEIDAVEKRNKVREELIKKDFSK